MSTPASKLGLFSNDSQIEQLKKNERELLINIKRIDNHELVNILNNPTDIQFQLILDLIQQKEADYLNQVIGVSFHNIYNKNGDNDIPPYWSTSCTKRTYKESIRVQENSAFTTLANIIATNELNFSTDKMVSLFQTLIHKRVDFSVTDHSPYQNIITFNSGNNPLKSLIVSSLGNQDLVELLNIFIEYIETIDNERNLIINNNDNFTYDSMTPAGFLLRQGNEDLALRLYQLGAIPAQQDFLFACDSFGTTEHYLEAKECILIILEKIQNGELIHALELELEDLIEIGLTSLRKAVPMHNSKESIFNKIMFDINKSEDEWSFVSQQARRLYDNKYSNQGDAASNNSSFEVFYQKMSIETPIIQDLFKLNLGRQNIGRGFFSKFYRVNNQEQMGLYKYELLEYNSDASNALEEVLSKIVHNSNSVNRVVEPIKFS